MVKSLETLLPFFLNKVLTFLQPLGSCHNYEQVYSSPEINNILNVMKTNYAIFKPRQKKFNSSISLSFGGKPLQQSNITKFLGVYIDDHLTWKHHISYVCKQIAKSIGIIFRSRFFLSSTTKLTLYYTLIYPYIVYCNCAWSSTYVSNLNRIYYLQKRAVRAITN